MKKGLTPLDFEVSTCDSTHVTSASPTPDPSSWAMLIGSDLPQTGLLPNTLTLLKGRLSSVLGGLFSFPRDSQQWPIIGPYLVRSLLELSLTIILGRIDPFRLLIVRENQAQDGYDWSRRNQSAIQWTGDLIPDGSKKASNLWGPDNKLEAYNRALLGEYYDHLFWVPAVQNSIESFDTEEIEILGRWKRFEARQVVPQIRQVLREKYSNLSKSVHHENMLEGSTPFVTADLPEHIKTSLEYVALLGLFTHYSTVSLYPLSHDRCKALLISIQTDLENIP